MRPSQTAKHLGIGRASSIGLSGHEADAAAHLRVLPAVMAAGTPEIRATTFHYVRGPPLPPAPSHRDGRAKGAFLKVLEANSLQLSGDVSRARLVGRLRGFAGVPGHVRQSYGPGWALVGDAGYFKDPLTAHGISDALRDAELLARAMLDGSPCALEDYQHRRDALSQSLFQVTEAIASFRWSLDEIKTLHASLSASMKTECEYMAGLAAPLRREPQTRSGPSVRNAALAFDAC